MNSHEKVRTTGERSDSSIERIAMMGVSPGAQAAEISARMARKQNSASRSVVRLARSTRARSRIARARRSTIGCSPESTGGGANPGRCMSLPVSRATPNAPRCSRCSLTSRTRDDPTRQSASCRQFPASAGTTSCNSTASEPRSRGSELRRSRSRFVILSSRRCGQHHEWSVWKPRSRARSGRSAMTLRQREAIVVPRLSSLPCRAAAKRTERTRKNWHESGLDAPSQSPVAPRNRYCRDVVQR